MNLQSHFENFKNKVSGGPDGYLFAENVKYTNLKSLFEEDFDLIRKTPVEILKNKSLQQPGVHSKLSNIAHLSFGPQDYFSQLSQDFSDDLLEITVDKDSLLLHPLELTLATEAGHCSASNIKIVVGESSSVKIYIRELGPAGTLSIPQIHIHLEPFSSLEFLFLQDDSLESYVFSTTNFHLGEGSSLKSLSVSLGSKLSRHQLNIFHSGINSTSSAKGIYLPAAHQHMDHYTSIDHVVGSCSSSQHYKGILGSNSKAVFNGSVVIREGAAKASSEQLNNNLVLDSSAEIDSKPELEIFNDDVKATHGSTVGQLNADEIFYLQSRGISKEAAIELLSFGFIAELISDISDDATRKSIHSKLESKLKILTGAASSVVGAKA